MKYTLDTNCLIALEQNEKNAPYLRGLLKKYRAKELEVAYVAISASENQKGGRRYSNFKEFRELLLKIDLQDVIELHPMAYFDVAFWDHVVFGGDESKALELKIHQILFPDTPISKPQEVGYPERKWRNQKCDVQVAWSHIHYGRDVLVTADENFHKKAAALAELGLKSIVRPVDVPH